MAIVLFRHVCAEIIIIFHVFYKGNGKKKKTKILSFGVNQMDINKNMPGIHAECDAITKLISLKPKKKLENISILVIRVSPKNKIQSSKPCNNCIETMIHLPPKKGYIITNIYYSDISGNIIKSSLNNLKKEERHYSKFYKNQKIQS